MIEFSITDYQTKFNYSEYNYIPILGLNIKVNTPKIIIIPLISI
jgi:hypothetical protein